jgi:WD40 repeat protein
MTQARFLIVLGAAASFAAQRAPAADSSAKDAAAAVSYYRQIRPIVVQQCQGCHQPAKAKGAFVMTSVPEMLKAGDSQQVGVVPGKPEKSFVFKQISAQNGKAAAMPKGQAPLIEHDVALIKQWIAEGARDDTPASAREIVDLDHPPRYALPPVIDALDYSPDGSLLAASGYHEVLLFHGESPAASARLVGESEHIQSLAFSPDGKLLAVTGGSPCRFGEVQIWDVHHKRLKLSLPVTFDTIYGVSWSPDGKKIAFGCADNTVRAIDAETGKQVLYQGAHNDWVLGTAFSKDGSHLVSISRDRSMKLIEVSTQRFIDNITSITPGALKGGLMTVARDPAKDELLIGGADGAPKIYQMYRKKKRVIGDDFNLVRAFQPMPGRVFAVKYSPDGKLIAAGSSFDGSGEVRTYEAATGKLVARFEGQHGAVYALAFRPDGKQVASAGFDGAVRLNDPVTGKLVRQFVPVPLSAAKVAVTTFGTKRK